MTNLKRTSQVIAFIISALVFIPDIAMAKQIRVALVQYEVGKTKTMDQWRTHLESYLKDAKKAQAELVVFPELIVLDGVAMDDPTGQHQAEVLLTFAKEKTSAFKELFRKWSQTYGLAIVASSWPVIENKKVFNVSFVFEKGKLIHSQKKRHLTQEEKTLYHFSDGDDDIKTFLLPGLQIQTAVAICYDVEFPMFLSSTSPVAELVIVPSMTEQNGLHRVARTASARAVEYHNYILVTGTVGGKKDDPVLGQHYGQAQAYSPSDIGFPSDGVLTKGTLNKSGLTVISLDFERLRKSRRQTKFFPMKDMHTK